MSERKAGVLALDAEDLLTKKYHKAKKLITSSDPEDRAEADKLLTEFLTTIGKEAFGPGWELKGRCDE